MAKGETGEYIIRTFFGQSQCIAKTPDCPSNPFENWFWPMYSSVLSILYDYNKTESVWNYIIIFIINDKSFESVKILSVRWNIDSFLSERPWPVVIFVSRKDCNLVSDWSTYMNIQKAVNRLQSPCWLKKIIWYYF